MKIFRLVRSISPTAETFQDALRAVNTEASSVGFYNTYYVPRGDSPINALMNDVVNTNGSAKVLFSGHRGSGKTTELYNLKEKLEEKGFNVVFVAAVKEMNVADLYYTDLLLALVKKSMELFSSETSKFERKQRKNLEENMMQLAGELVKEDITEKKRGITLKLFADWIEAFFGREKTTRETIRLKADSLVHEIIKTFNSMITSYETAIGKKVVIIVDDLEKVTDEGRMTDVLLKYGNIIRDLSCHIVLTVPSSLLYSGSARLVSMTYGYIHFLPPFRVRNKDGSKNSNQLKFMREIIMRRISSRLLNGNLLDDMAMRSGGLVTDYFRMMKVSLNKAFSSNLEKVDSRSADEAFIGLVSEYGRLVSYNSYNFLKEINEAKDGEKNELFRSLLFYLIVLEYIEDGDNWYDIHPAVEQFLRKKKILGSQQ
jgi:hypothetical protein